MKQQLTEVSDSRTGIHWENMEMAMDYICQKKLREEIELYDKSKNNYRWKIKILLFNIINRLHWIIQNIHYYKTDMLWR